jgi:plasmid stability protein
MANLQVKNIPEELHERLRRHARRNNCTMSAAVLAAIEREIERGEWRERMANRPSVDLGVPAAQLIEEARAERDRELGIE